MLFPLSAFLVISLGLPFKTEKPSPGTFAIALAKTTSSRSTTTYDDVRRVCRAGDLTAIRTVAKGYSTISVATSVALTVTRTFGLNLASGLDADGAAETASFTRHNDLDNLEF